MNEIKPQTLIVCCAIILVVSFFWPKAAMIATVPIFIFSYIPTWGIGILYSAFSNNDFGVILLWQYELLLGSYFLPTGITILIVALIVLIIKIRNSAT